MGNVMLTLVVLLLGLRAVESLWPTPCTSPEALRNRTCCPYFKGGRCGSTSGRGECVFQNASSEGVRQDERSSWSKFYYDYTCVCKPNFYGPECGSCSPAYREPDCILRKYIVRPDITELSLKELKAFLMLLNYCKWKLSTEYMVLHAGHRLFPDTFQFKPCSYYDLIVYAMYYAQRPLRQGNGFRDINFHYESTGYLTRNRAMLLQAEHFMQLCSKNQYFVFPYYDYTRYNTCVICDNRYMGESNEHGELHPHSVFSTWRTFCGQYDFEDQHCYVPDCLCQQGRIYRNPGYDRLTSIPTREELRRILEIKAYDTPPYNTDSLDSFRCAVEGYLNPYNPRSYGTSMNYMWSQYLSGTMGEFQIAANDPIFLLNMCFTDKMFEMWRIKQNAGPDNYPPNQAMGHMGSSCILCTMPCITHREMMVSSPNNFGRSFARLDDY